ATCCRYCGDPTVGAGQLKDMRKPGFILPFAMDKNAAVAALKKHYKGKLFLPSTFTSKNQINKLQGLYVPFWLFDAEADADMSFEGTRSHSHRSGDYIITRTEHYDVRRCGRFSFAKVPADASKKMPDALMDSIEPFDYSALTDFSTAYLPGFMADRFDVTVEQDSARIDKRCTSSCEGILRDDVSGYSEVKTTGRHVDIKRGKVHYALLPVWVMTTKWNNKDYLFVMNGQTGKLVGDLPVDKKKYKLFKLGVGLAIAAILFATGISGFFGTMISAMVG
ncbi:MAG: hypothetical protein MJ067_06175, partial [Oscillospiraceae bacterium]|nr:hypothetical protein [Oscillospiraceae bacterium]